MNQEEKSKGMVLDLSSILKIIPHRYPFILVDKIIELDLDKGHIVGQKNVTINEAFFQGHFPEVPIMPGVLIIEALAQTGSVLALLHNQTKKIPVLSSITQAKFRQGVKPGDILYLQGDTILLRPKGGKLQAKAMVEDKVAVEAEIGFVLVDKEKIQ